MRGGWALSLRSWGAAGLLCCAVAVTPAAAAPHRTTWQRRTTSSRSLARCLAGRRVEPVAFTHSLLCYLAASIQTNFLSIYQTSSIRFHIDMPPSEVSESANDVPEVGDVHNNIPRKNKTINCSNFFTYINFKLNKVKKPTLKSM